MESWKVDRRVMQIEIKILKEDTVKEVREHHAQLQRKDLKCKEDLDKARQKSRYGGSSIKDLTRQMREERESNCPLRRQLDMAKEKYKLLQNDLMDGKEVQQKTRIDNEDLRDKRKDCNYYKSTVTEYLQQMTRPPPRISLTSCLTQRKVKTNTRQMQRHQSSNEGRATTTGNLARVRRTH